jgi:hypothetical protein
MIGAIRPCAHGKGKAVGSSSVNTSWSSLRPVLNVIRLKCYWSCDAHAVRAVCVLKHSGLLAISRHLVSVHSVFALQIDVQSGFYYTLSDRGIQDVADDSSLSSQRQPTQHRHPHSSFVCASCSAVQPDDLRSC